MPRGRYRSLVRRVTRDIMSAIIDNRDVRRFKTVLPAPDYYYLWNPKWRTDPLRPKTAIGFDVDLRVKRIKGRKFDVFASVCEDELGNSHIDIEIVHDPDEKTHLSELYVELGGSIRHEIEHITEEGQLAGMAPLQDRTVPHVPTRGKIVHTLNRRAKLLSNLHPNLDAWGREEMRRLNDAIDGDMLAYLTCYEEVGPLTQGFYYEAKKRRVPVDVVIDMYLARLKKHNLLTDDDIEEAFEHLAAWTKLTLPAAVFSC